MTTRRLDEFNTLTFDCYGTLIDWESGIWDALQPVLLENGRDDVTRSIGLETFARHEGEQQTATPSMLYPEVLSMVHARMAEEFSLRTTAEMNDTFGASVEYWPAFPDSADALRQLKKHYKLVILSNVNQAGFAASNKKLGVEFDAIYTAEDVGSYKPNSANFDYMLHHIKEDLGVESQTILHTAQSLFHDHKPATTAGLNRAWIDRQRLSEGGDWGATAPVEGLTDPDFLFFTMQDMATARDAIQS